MIKTCIDCQNLFEVEEGKSWAKRCLPCWKKDKQKDAVYQLQIENRQLKSEIIQLRALAKLRPNPMMNSSTTPDGFDEMIRTLIQLCHPDKHNGSPAATKATQWLLKQR